LRGVVWFDRHNLSQCFSGYVFQGFEECSKRGIIPRFVESRLCRLTIWQELTRFILCKLCCVWSNS
jgi:hypothetical protein